MQTDSMTGHPDLKTITCAP